MQIYLSLPPPQLIYSITLATYIFKVALFFEMIHENTKMKDILIANFLQCPQNPKHLKCIWDNLDTGTPFAI